MIGSPWWISFPLWLPLILTLSPQERGEGIRAALVRRLQPIRTNMIGLRVLCRWDGA
jgi:hypothetical protein